MKYLLAADRQEACDGGEDNDGEVNEGLASIVEFFGPLMAPRKTVCLFARFAEVVLQRVMPCDERSLVGIIAHL